jgi:hypothetical protein
VKRTVRTTAGAALATAAIVAVASTAHASMPVPRTITGCVIEGAFTSDDGYLIRAKRAGFEDYDLGGFEGRRIRVRGMLSPGDLFVVKGRPRDLGSCRRPR